ncbi:MAG: CoA-binding protein [Candidatus Pacebacteria bacterium]|nr:CoA-binding protein [Candidatus Paceibacterota bacterium]
MTRNLSKILNPKTIAVIGATSRPHSVGFGICKNLLQGKSKRKIFFINPYRKKVLKRKTYSSIVLIKDSIDLAIVAVPANIVSKVIQECCEKKVGGILVISAGFAEIGKNGKLLQEKITKQVKLANIPLIGPNCLGIIKPFIDLNASFVPEMPKKGKIGFISQSGALINSVIDKSLLENYGFSTMISYGNEADLNLNDFLEELENDKNTKVICLYLEGVKYGREFLNIAKRISKVKPIIAIKAGRQNKAKQSIASHTGVLAGDYQVFKAVFKQSGIIEADSLEDLLDVAKALAWQPKCKNGIGVITNGGGAGVLMADFCEGLDIRLSGLQAKTIKRLKDSKITPPSCSFLNPLDIVGDALSDRYEVAIKALLEQENIFGLVVMQTTQIMTNSKKNAEVVIKSQKRWPKKPIITCFMGGKFTKPGIDLLEKNKIPNYSDPKRAAIAMKALLR